MADHWHLLHFPFQRKCVHITVVESTRRLGSTEDILDCILFIENEIFRVPNLKIGKSPFETFECVKW